MHGATLCLRFEDLGQSYNSHEVSNSFRLRRCVHNRSARRRTAGLY